MCKTISATNHRKALNRNQDNQKEYTDNNIKPRQWKMSNKQGLRSRFPISMALHYCCRQCPTNGVANSLHELIPLLR
jgi:hypothetical protein